MSCSWKRNLSFLPPLHWLLEEKRFASFALIITYILWPWNEAFGFHSKLEVEAERFAWNARLASKNTFCSKEFFRKLCQLLISPLPMVHFDPHLILFRLLQGISSYRSALVDCCIQASGISIPLSLLTLLGLSVVWVAFFTNLCTSECHDQYD